MRAILCEEMHWTWQEFQSQPAHFITMLLEYRKARRINEKKKNK